LCDDFVYQGFDAVAVYNELVRIEPSKKILKNDMQTFVMFCIMRGPNFMKQLGKSTSEANKIITDIGKKYNIKENISNQRKRDEVTAGRILSLFPTISMKICEAGVARDPAPEVSIPDKYRFFQAPSVIPDDKTFKEWIVWAIAADKVINPTKHDEEKVRKFAEVQRKSSVFLKKKE
jgi:hypothetical protein